ncbi:MAG: pyridoxal-phosphate dependent enzyme, partial [Aureliella sp.]
EDVRRAAKVIAPIVSPAPLIRSYALERQLKLPAGRHVWIKDYGWTPVGSFKLLGALNWMSRHATEIGDRPVVAHSSGNFASGLAFAGKTFGKHVIIVMPEDAPQIKFKRTRDLGAEILTYDKSQDHVTGQRDRLTLEITERQQAMQASPYDDNDVIAGNGVGGLEIVHELKEQGRELSHFICAVSGGGLLAGHALAIHDGFPSAKIVAVEPSGATDFAQSLASGQRTRVERPQSICDGLLSYDVGQHNWPILQEHVGSAVSITDGETCRTMRWIDSEHGLRTEPSGAISIAALMSGQIDMSGTGDIVVVLSGRNVDGEQFATWVSDLAFSSRVQRHAERGD